MTDENEFQLPWFDPIDGHPIEHVLVKAGWDETKHPRGGKKNPGQFAAGGAGAAPAVGRVKPKGLEQFRAEQGKKPAPAKKPAAKPAAPPARPAPGAKPPKGAGTFTMAHPENWPKPEAPKPPAPPPPAAKKPEPPAAKPAAPAVKPAVPKFPVVNDWQIHVGNGQKIPAGLVDKLREGLQRRGNPFGLMEVMHRKNEFAADLGNGLHLHIGYGNDGDAVARVIDKDGVPFPGYGKARSDHDAIEQLKNDLSWKAKATAAPPAPAPAQGGRPAVQPNWNRRADNNGNLVGGDWNRDQALEFMLQHDVGGGFDFQKDGDEQVADLKNGMQIRALKAGDQWIARAFDAQGQPLYHLRVGDSPDAAASALVRRVRRRFDAGEFKGPATQAAEANAAAEAHAKELQEQQVRIQKEEERRAQAKAEVKGLEAHAAKLKAAPPPIVAATPEKRQLESLIRTAKTTGDTDRGGGINITIKGHVEGDGDAAIKPLANHGVYGSPHHEAIAYEMSEQMKFGVVPVTIVKQYNGDNSAVRKGEEVSQQAWNNNAIMAGQLARGGDRNHPITDATKDSFSRMTVLDFVTGNTDRHGGNWLYDEQTHECVAIDNGFSCLNEGDRGGHSSQFDYADSNARKLGMDQVEVKKEHLEAAKKYIQSDEYRDTILRHFTPEKYIAQKAYAEKGLKHLEKHARVI